VEESLNTYVTAPKLQKRNATVTCSSFYFGFSVKCSLTDCCHSGWRQNVPLQAHRKQTFAVSFTSVFVLETVYDTYVVAEQK